MSVAERIGSIFKREKKIVRQEELSPAEQKALRIYYYESVAHDWALFMNATTSGQELGGYEDVRQIATDLEERGFLKVWREAELGKVRQLSADGKRAFKQISKEDGAFNRPIVVRLPVTERIDSVAR